MKAFFIISLIMSVFMLGCDKHPQGSTAMICRGGFCGTAFMTKERIWITAAHTLKHEGEPILIHPLVGYLRIDVRKIDFKKDIATFQTSMLFDFEPWTLCDFIPPPGSSIYAITETLEYDIREGKTVLPVYKVKGYSSNMLYLNIKLKHGYSGGPVVYDYTGCVIGMTQGQLKSKNTAAVNVHELKDFK